MAYLLNTSHTSRLFHISTRELPTNSFINGSKSFFRVNLQSPIIAKDSERLLVSLYSASIPMSFYSLDSFENVVSFSEGPYSASFTMTPGNYTMKQVAAMVQANMTLLSPNHFTYTCTYNVNTSKLTISCNDSLVVKSLNLDVANSAYTALGFSSGKYYFSSTITSQNVTSLHDKYSLFVRTSLNSTSAYNTDGSFSNILERIPIVTNGSVLFYEQPASLHKTLLDVKFINAFEVALTYDDGRLVDLQGLPFELTIRFDWVDGLQRGQDFNIRQEVQDAEA